MNTTLDIEVPDRWFEGHFPGNPILPGVAQLALVVEALSRERGAGLALGGIPFVRLRQPVRPGERLRLTIEAGAHDRQRIALTRDGTAVMNGELRFGLPAADRPAAPALPALVVGAEETNGNSNAQSPCSPSPTQEPQPTRFQGASRQHGVLHQSLPKVGARVVHETAGRPFREISMESPPVEALLPHRAPMRFVTRVLDESATRLRCAASIPSACPLVADGFAPALVAIEAAAQTGALWEALRRWRAGPGAGPLMGYLVGLRHVAIFATRVPADAPLIASVTLEALSSPLAHYAIQVDLAGRCILHGTLSAFLAGSQPPG